MDSTMNAIPDDLDSLLMQLEHKELTGELEPSDYETFLALYLATSDMINAKFLWQRIPVNVKESALLKYLWELSEHLMKCDFAPVYQMIDSYQWPSHLENSINHLRSELQRRNVQLINKSYSSIRLDDALKMTGCTAESIVNLSQSQNWVMDPQFGFVISRKNFVEDDGGSSNQEQLEKLADYISFLENS
ncbi:COP9 signalosome subunit 8 [Brevipalpus obovatus]|uniref:COP9 signalosome subunit 8 n=1 Tax=Brevipalpus obovatus TaxID=246614 RepID=UPI003D9E7BC5